MTSKSLDHLSNNSLLIQRIFSFLFFACRAVSTAGAVNERYYFCLLLVVVGLVVVERDLSLGSHFKNTTT